jgi:septal ring factor EnvC (AmiA/AmiB activator)
MTFEEKLKGNLLWFALCMLFTGFVAGAGLYDYMQERFEAISKQKRSEVEQDLERLKKQLDERNQEKRNLEQDLQQLQKQLHEKIPPNSDQEQTVQLLQRQVDQDNQQNQNLEQKLQQLQNQLDEKKDENSKLDQARQQLQKQLDASNKQLLDLQARLDADQRVPLVGIRLAKPADGDAADLISQLEAQCISRAPFKVSTEQDADTLMWDNGSSYYILQVLGGPKKGELWNSGKIYKKDVSGRMKEVVESVCRDLSRRLVGH